MEDDVDPRNRLADGFWVGHIPHDEINTVLDFSQVVIVPCAQVVEHTHLVAHAHEFRCEMGTDKPGSTSYQISCHCFAPTMLSSERPLVERRFAEHENGISVSQHRRDP
jgi:hypothetical protein